eukprot:scaffold652_cov68-Phaeocystis_antarctica.AAC.4
MSSVVARCLGKPRERHLASTCHSSATAFCAVCSVRDHVAMTIRASTLASASRGASVWFDTMPCMLWCWLRRWPCWCAFDGGGAATGGPSGALDAAGW